MEVGIIPFPLLPQMLHPDVMRLFDQRDEIVAQIFAQLPDFCGRLTIERNFIPAPSDLTSVFDFSSSCSKDMI